VDRPAQGVFIRPGQFVWVKKKQSPVQKHLAQNAERGHEEGGSTKRKIADQRGARKTITGSTLNFYALKKNLDKLIPQQQVATKEGEGRGRVVRKLTAKDGKPCPRHLDTHRTESRKKNRPRKGNRKVEE